MAKKTKKHIRTLDEMFESVQVGTGAMHHCGSDTYGYYVSEVNKDEKTIGVYRPQEHFTKCWEDGSLTPDPFDPEHPTEMRYVAWRGRWWKLDADGLRTRETMDWRFGPCYSYQNPSF